MMMPVTVLELRVTSRSLAPCGGRVTGSLPVGSGLPDSEAAQSPTGRPLPSQASPIRQAANRQPGVTLSL